MTWFVFLAPSWLVIAVLFFFLGILNIVDWAEKVELDKLSASRSIANGALLAVCWLISVVSWTAYVVALTLYLVWLHLGG